MTIYVLEFTDLLLAALILFVPINNMLIYPLKSIQKIVLLAHIFLAYIITYKVNPNNINMAVFTMGGALFIIFIYHKSIYNLGSAIIGYLTMVCFNYIVLMYLNIFGVTPQLITGDILNLIAFEIIFCTATYAVTFFLGKGLREIVKKHNTFIKKKSMRYFIFSNLCGCLVIFLLFIILGRVTGFTDMLVMQNGFIFFIIIFSVTVVIMVKVFAKIIEAKAEDYNDLFQLMNDLSCEIKDIKIRQHDYKNLISSINGYAKKGMNRELCEYLDKNLIATDLSNLGNCFSQLHYLEISPLKTLLEIKISHALKQNISIELFIKEEIIETPMNEKHLTCVMGILMDNAIEAAAESDEKHLQIGIWQDLFKKECTIKIANSFLQMPEVNRLFEFGYTTKGKGEDRGIGLYNLQNIISQYECCFKTDIDIENKIFTTELNIYEEE